MLGMSSTFTPLAAVAKSSDDVMGSMDGERAVKDAEGANASVEVDVASSIPVVAMTAVAKKGKACIVACIGLF